MTVNYEQLKLFVKEAMFTGGGINEPSAPEGIPHRMPAADTESPEQEKGDEKANELYELALVAREAAEVLVEALDEPVFDSAYEHAFKASACLRRALNSLEQSGAHPMPQQRVVAPAYGQQKHTGGSNAGDYAGGAGLGSYAMPIGMIEEEEKIELGKTGISRTAQAKGERERGQAISKGDILQGVDNKERAMLVDIEELLTKVADETNLLSFRPQLIAVIKNIIAKVPKETQLGPNTEKFLGKS
jgi:hypothetical protein